MPAAWKKKSLISTSLLPLSWVYGLALRLRRLGYRYAPRCRYRSPVPILIVGNLYVGGTGKTPVVIAAVKALQKMGWHPGVVSRGYGITIKGSPRLATGTADAAQIGDEPALITQSTGAPIGVHPKRPLAVQALLQAHPDIDIIVADDGLQHLALERDIEIIVQDERGTGNGRLLPAGPLREPASRLRSVDLVITHTPSRPATKPGTDAALTMSLQPVSVSWPTRGQTISWYEWLRTHQHTPVAALAGIGNPARFFTMLKHHGLELAHAQGLPDHGHITPELLANVDADLILITAKDAVKCQHLNDNRLRVVNVCAEFSQTEWLAALLAGKKLRPPAR